MTCPCGSQRDYDACCGPYIAGEALPPTAEALMRSRYTAYTRQAVGYLRDTLAPEALGEFDAKATETWAKTSRFTNLAILATEKGGAGDEVGTVEFLAKFTQGGDRYEHHEVSEFRKDEAGRWLYVSGQSHRHGGDGHHHHHHGQERKVPIVRAGPKVGRNDPCPCGSGKKHKKCCAAA